MSRPAPGLCQGLIWLAMLGIAHAQPPAAEPEPPPPAGLSAEEERTVSRLTAEADVLARAGDFAAAAERAAQVAEVRTARQGADHWESRDAQRRVERLHFFADRPPADQERIVKALGLQQRGLAHLRGGRLTNAQDVLAEARALWDGVLPADSLEGAECANGLAGIRNAQFRYAEADQLYRHALAARRAVLGEEHPETANSYNNVAFNLDAWGRHREAEPLHEQAFAIRLKVLGPQHELTGNSYNNRAMNLVAQGRYQDAIPVYEAALKLFRDISPESAATATVESNLGDCRRGLGEYEQADAHYARALDLFTKLSGAESLPVATVHNNLALNLEGQGKHAEAQRYVERALAVVRGIRGDLHPDTATAYSNVGMNLLSQGRYADAERQFAKALEIFRTTVGEKHRYAATACNNLADALRYQRRFEEAQPLFERALEIRREVLSENHPDTAQTYSNAAVNLAAQYRHAEAQPLLEKALAIFRDKLGERHPDTAIVYSQLAANLDAQGKFLEAEPLHRTARDIRQSVWGAVHPETAQSLSDLARNLSDQGRYADAEQLWSQAATSFEQARLRFAVTGLGRAVKSAEQSPLEYLAGAQARNGKTGAAWTSLEQGLAGGLRDDLAARSVGRLSEPDQDRRRELLARARRVDSLLGLVHHRPSDALELAQFDALRQAQLDLQAELSEFEQVLVERYGVVEGEAFDLPRVQRALPADAALVTWLDLPARDGSADPNGEHWGIVVRKTGDPTWVRLPPEQEIWSLDEDLLGQQLADVMALRTGAEALGTASQVEQLIADLRRQRVAPLAAQLDRTAELPPVRQLIVLPSVALRGVPVELLFDAQYTVSYAPSATFFTWLIEQRRGERPAAAESALLAVGDPAFERPEDHPPDAGLLVTSVAKDGRAARAGLQVGDVLLAYGSKTLRVPGDLLAAIAASPAPDGTAELTVWNQGKIRKVPVEIGKLGLGMVESPHTRAKAPQENGVRFADERFPPLPATRLEVAAIASALPAQAPRLLLLGSDANERRLIELATRGELKGYRFLHFATHGVPDANRPMHSRIILARDGLAIPDGGADLAAEEVLRGEITAERVLHEWELDADLVTLSACQSALGRFAGGEGYLGFAQALLLSGSRSLVLSLWKVDDTATALLMARFYENMLGARPDQRERLPKAAALREAKLWVQALTPADVERMLSAWKGGTPMLTVAPSAGGAAARPYRHPTYWAAFVLIGDPG